MVQDRRAYGIDGSNHPALYSVGQWFKNWMVRNSPRASVKVTGSCIQHGPNSFGTLD
jgi:hypothetical protein